MADVFAEVDEELSRDRYRELWRRYWKIGAAVVGAVLLAVGVHEFTSWRTASRAASASRAYDAAVRAAQEGAPGVREDFAELAADGPRGYRALSLMGEASIVLSTGEALQASALFEEAARLTRDPILRDLAALKAAYARADELSMEDLRALVEPLAEQGRPFRTAARELLAATYWAAGDLERAHSEYSLLAFDPQTPDLMRARAEQALALIRASEAIAAAPLAPADAPDEADPEAQPDAQEEQG